MSKARNLSELAGEEIEKMVLSKEEMKEMVEKFKAKFGGFSRRYMNIFYDEFSIAKIKWEQKIEDGSKEKLPHGKLVSVYEYPEWVGQKAFGKYKYENPYPYLFWEECFRQISEHIAKREYAQKQELLELDNIAQQA